MQRPIPLARAGQNGAPQGCAERIEDSHAQDADLFEPRDVSTRRVRRRLGVPFWPGFRAAPGCGVCVQIFDLLSDIKGGGNPPPFPSYSLATLRLPRSVTGGTGM